MKKASLKLFDVHSNFKVKFMTFIESDPMNPNNAHESRQVVNKFLLNGNEYVNVSPSSFVVIDISTKQDKGDNYSSNTSFSLDRRKLFSFILRLEKLYRSFTNEKDLFFIDRSNQLAVNHDAASKHKEILQVCGQKTIQMEPCVCRDPESNAYEGIYLAVNSLNYYSNLTYDQMQYLIFELKKIDFSSLEINLINVAFKYIDVTGKEIKKELITQPDEIIIKDTKKKIYIEDTNTIPDI